MSEAAVTSTRSFTLEDLKSLTDSGMQRVNQLITDNLASDVVLINQLSQHIILGGGKRLRPMLVMLSARACGYDGENDALLAAVVEFIHTATLLHDDVVDDSDMRRGQQTASAIWGNEAAVLVGDYLYSRAFQMMVRAQSMEIMDLLANTTNTIAQGEVLQLLNIRDPDTTEARYDEVIYAKTACLFEAAGRIGTMLAMAAEPQQQSLQEYGKHLGIAFQLIDDALDYTAESDELGKNVGDDLAEGKPTLPLIHAMENGDERLREMIRSAIKNGSADRFDDINQAIRDTGALQYTIDRAQDHAERAKKAIADLASSDFKQALLFIADYAVERSY
ncbi:MAG: polyprenyl synthetase family protein [Gammaproteobacteria bacterium]|nr:MAG: polyprenyl synthetase family protein [Gammaproteobacteria bacterium]